MTVTGRDALPAPLAAVDDATAYSPPLWQQNRGFPAAADRSLIGAIWQRPGLIDGLTVTPRAEGANMTVDVAPGAAVVEGTDSPDQGKYLCPLIHGVNAPITAAPGAGLARIDAIVAQVFDDAVTGTGAAEWRIVVVTGTAAANPVVPTLPPSSLLRATIRVDAGTASIAAAAITNIFTAAGDIPVRARAYRTGVQGMIGGIQNQIVFNTIDFISDPAIWDLTTGEFIAPQPGDYLFTAACQLDAATTTVTMGFFVGAIERARGVQINGATNGVASWNMAEMVPLLAGQRLSCRVFVTALTSVSVNPGPETTWMTVRALGPN